MRPLWPGSIPTTLPASGSDGGTAVLCVVVADVVVVMAGVVVVMAGVVVASAPV